MYFHNSISSSKESKTFALRALWQLAKQPVVQRISAAAIGAVALLTIPSQGARSDSFCYGGCPTGASAANTHVTYDILELSNNPVTKFSDWVAYEVTLKNLDKAGSSCGKRVWHADAKLDPDTTLKPEDYRDAESVLHSDHGHQAPFDDFCGTPDWPETDNLPNVTPQFSTLNRGPWKGLESGERRLVKRHYADIVYTVTGTLYEKDMPPLPHAHLPHKVPSGYFKIVTVEVQSGPEVAAFIMQQDMKGKFCTALVTPEEVQARAHLQFFPQLDEATRSDILAGRKQGNLLQELGCK